MLYEVFHDSHTIHLFGGSRPTTTPWSSPALHKHLVVKRNHAWLPRIDAMFAAHTRAFVVVGTAHLVGDDGLLALLPRAGFPVSKGQP